MKYSVFTASTPEWSPEHAAQILAEQGWDGIEWRITDQPPAESPGFWAGNRCTWPMADLEHDLERIRRITSDAGLEFSGLGGYARCDNPADVERMLAATASLGARQVRVTTLPHASADSEGRTYPELLEQTRRQIARIAEQAQQHGVKVLVELHKGTVIASASAAARLLEDVDPRSVGVIYDVGNLVSEGYEDPLSAMQLLGDHLAHVHVKNNRWVVAGSHGSGIMAGTVDWAPQPAPLREGQADLERQLRAMRAVGYDGWIAVEDFSTDRPLAERTADNLAYLKALEARIQAE